ncbi:MAG: hypothetical protein PF542_06440 [Nanoarchaeota archaeon]|nr:hypothetical protein [Nanoarchaeota archaeon]
MDINNENLESALNNSAQPNETQQAPPMSAEMEIGFHQGALNTLASERAELNTMIQNVEKIMGMHIQRLEQMGVKVQTKK